MTRAECLKMLADKSHPQHKEFSHMFHENYNKCKQYYEQLGFKGYTLHHKIVDCTNYEEWKIDEIVPLTRSEHSRLHSVYYKQGLGATDEEKRKAMREKAAATYRAHEHIPWNKGLTKETDSRIKDSPRLGKTGKDFPFLCASKKGKSGGWNRGRKVYTNGSDFHYCLINEQPEGYILLKDYLKLHNCKRKDIGKNVG